VILTVAELTLLTNPTTAAKEAKKKQIEKDWCNITHLDLLA